MLKIYYFLLIFILYSANTFLFGEEENIIAVIQSFQGNIQIIDDTNNKMSPVTYLCLKPGYQLTIAENAELLLYLYTGQQILLSAKEKLAVSITNYSLKGLNKSTKKYIKNHLKEIYTGADIAGSMSYINHNSSTIPENVQKKINLAEVRINNSLLLHLFKGDIYRQYGLEQLASEEFRMHWRKKRLIEK